MFQLHFIEIQDPVFQRTIWFIFQRIFVLQTRIRLHTFINIQMISTSEIKVSVLIPAKDADLAVKAIHDKFFE